MHEDVDDRLFVALVGDIRGSRELADCHDTQQAFNAVFDALNDWD